MTGVESFTDNEEGVMFPRLVPMVIVMVTLAALLQWSIPVQIVSDVAFLEDIDPDLLVAFGVLVAVGGFALSLAGYRALRRRGADVDPAQPVTVLVTDGVFAWTRNPIYLGIWVALGGVALAFAADWLLILIAPASVIVNLAAVRPEEAYLAQKFGRIYRDYRRRVPRYVFMH
jgi:protein-S-isoprenylcysteine O-methyltransferase Ste14